MTNEISNKRPLTQLKHEIDETASEASRLEAERNVVAEDLKRADRQLRLLQLARTIRKPAASFDLWPPALLLVGPCIIGVLTFIVTHVMFNSLLIALLGLLIGVAGSAAVFGALLYRPPDSMLPTAIGEAESQVKLIQARLNEKTERITETNERLRRLEEERRDQIASGKLQKAALLQRNWKSMRDAEWEDFVVEVCRTLGAKVDRIGPADGESANLIADFGSRRVAVLTQGEGHNVSSETVRNALAARDRAHCDSCAVIINRRFTGAAQHFAEHHGCTAIGTSEFPDFVMGKIEL